MLDDQSEIVMSWCSNFKCITTDVTVGTPYLHSQYLVITQVLVASYEVNIYLISTLYIIFALFIICVIVYLVVTVSVFMSVSRDRSPLY